MPEELMQESLSEDQELSSTESEESSEESQPTPEPEQRKYLGFFDDEKEAESTVRQMAERLSFYEQNQQVQAALNAERAAMERAKQAEQEQYSEHAKVHQLANALLAEGRGPEAIKVLSDHAAKQALSRVDDIVEAKLQGVVGPAYEKRQYLESEVGKEFPHLADKAVKLLQAGMSRAEIVDLFRAASNREIDPNAAKKAKVRALRDGYMEPPDGGSVQPAVAEGDFMKKNRSAFEEWFGKRPKK